MPVFGSQKKFQGELKLPETSTGPPLTEADVQLALSLAEPAIPMAEELKDLRWRMIILILRWGGGVRLGDVGSKDSGCLGAADAWARNDRKSRKRATLIRALKRSDDGVFEFVNDPDTNPLVMVKQHQFQ